MRQTLPFCLASASPRRRDLLAQYGLEFTVTAVEVDERRLAGEGAEAYVRRLAQAKAEAAREVVSGGLILAGDTAVVLEEEILGKPHGPGEAEAMLTRLSGKTHRVLSAYMLLNGVNGECCRGAPETRVTFRALPAEWIAFYSRLPEAQDKAGAYAIQGIGGAMVAAIEGSYTTVVGFPMEAIFWDCLRKGWIAL